VLVGGTSVGVETAVVEMPELPEGAVQIVEELPGKRAVDEVEKTAVVVDIDALLVVDRLSDEALGRILAVVLDGNAVVLTVELLDTGQVDEDWLEVAECDTVVGTLESPQLTELLVNEALGKTLNVVFRVKNVVVPVDVLSETKSLVVVMVEVLAVDGWLSEEFHEKTTVVEVNAVVVMAGIVDVNGWLSDEFEDKPPVVEASVVVVLAEGVGANG
jgi:hypothetical protein